MALVDNWKVVQLFRGVDTEQNDKTLVPGTPTELRNATFEERVSIEKRLGTEPLTRRRAGPSATYVSGALGVASRDDERELAMLATTDELLSYDPAGWSDRGDWVDLHLSLAALPRGPFEQFDPSMAQSGDTRLYAWEDRRGGVFVRFMHADGYALSNEYRIAGHVARAPRVHLVQNHFHVYFVSGTMGAPTLNCAVLPSGRPTAPSASYTVIATDIRPGDYVCPHPTYDVAPDRNCAYVAWSVSGSAAKVCVVRPDGVIGTSAQSPAWPDTKTWIHITQGPALALSGGLLAIAGIDYANVAAAGRVYRTVDLGINTELEAQDVIGLYATRRMACCWEGSTVHVLVELSSSDVVDRKVRRFSRDIDDGDGPLNSPTISDRLHSSLASKPFSFTGVGGAPFVWLNHPHPLQSTDILVRVSDGLPVARSRYRLAVTDVSGILPNVDVQGTVATRAVCQVDGVTLPAGDSGSVAPRDRHVRFQTVEYQPSSSWRPVDADGVLYFGGGWPGMYDGVQTVEHGFALASEVPVITVGSATLGTNLAIGGDRTLWAATSDTGRYLYAVVPEWTDARGNVHLGDILNYASASFSGSSTQVQNTASLSIRTIQHTMKDGVRAPDIRFRIYRTGPNGTALQRIDTAGSPVVNQTGSDRITFNDTVDEGTRRLGEVLYLQAERGPHIMAPAYRHAALAGDRLYAADLEDGRSDVMASKLRAGGAVAFTDDGRISVDAAGGQLTGLGGMDERVVAFKRGRAYSFPADGPGNSLGDPTPFPLPGAITSDVGCIEGGPVVPVAGTTVQGIMFRSERGTRLVGRDGAVQDIGGPMADYDDLTVVGGVQVPMRDEVRLHTAEGTTLSYDTRFGQWATHDLQRAVGSCRWDNRTVYARADGRCYADVTGTVYLDGSTPYPLSLTTGWIPLGQTNQGNSRFRAVQLLGDFLSPHTVRIEAAYDYRDEFEVLREISATGALDLTVYGGATEFDGGRPYGNAAWPAFLSASTLVNSSAGTDGVRFSGGSTWTGVLGARTSGSGGNDLHLQVVQTFGESADAVTVQDNRFYAGGETIVSGYILARIYTTGAAGSASTVTGWDLEERIMSASSLATVTHRDSANAGSAIQLDGGYSLTAQFVSGNDDGGTYGSRDPVYQITALAKKRQRMQAIRFRISDLNPSPDGGSFRLNELQVKHATVSPDHRGRGKKRR